MIARHDASRRRPRTRPRPRLVNPHRRRRGRGDERDRAAARAHGPSRERLRHQGHAACSARLEAAGVRRRDREPGRERARTTPTRSCTRPRFRPTNVELVGGARTRDPGAAPRRSRWPRSRRPAARSRSRARTGRRRPRRCSRSILREAGWNPSFLIGGELNEVGTNAAYGDGEWFVVEADESDGTFLRIAPTAAIVTNVEPDHLDHYGGFDALVARVRALRRRVPGPRGLRHRRPGRRARLAARRRQVRTYGEHADADYRIVDYRGGARSAAASRSSSTARRSASSSSRSG